MRSRARTGHDIIVQLFDYYSCADGGIGSIGLNQWSEFVEDFEIDDTSSKLCRKSDLDTLFIAVSFPGPHSARPRHCVRALYSAWRVPLSLCVVLQVNVASKKRERELGVKPGDAGDGKALNRVEFIMALVNVSIMKCVLLSGAPHSAPCTRHCTCTCAPFSPRTAVCTTVVCDTQVCALGRYP